MPEILIAYVRWIDAINRRIGHFAMYLILVLIGILLYAGVSKAVFGVGPIWSVEMASFTLAAIYMLGGAYSLQTGGHVRMDLFYGEWSPRTRALVDCLTVLGLLLYLGVLLVGAVESTTYAIETGQHRPSAWGPPLWPIRLVMATGVFLMLLQVIAIVIRDIAEIRGVRIP
jgi:TRAP-type mannitol/chloroaromatic compound transport system permease small subunit